MMNRREALTTLGASALSAVTGGVCRGDNPHTADDATPMISIHDALRLAEAYVKKHKIFVGDKHVTSATFHPEAQQPEWEIIWRTKRPVKGGWLAIHVRTDKSIEATYGE